MSSIFKSIKKRSKKAYSSIFRCRRKKQSLGKEKALAQQNEQFKQYFLDCENQQAVQIFEESENLSLGSDISNNDYKNELRKRGKLKHLLKEGFKFAFGNIFSCKKAKRKKVFTNKVKKLKGYEGLKIRSNLKARPILKYGDSDSNESQSSLQRPRKTLENLRKKNEEVQYMQTALKLANQLTKIEHLQDDLICPLCLKFLVHATVTKCGHTYCYICFQELVLVSPTCLKCDRSLRKHRIAASCKAIDSMVENLICSLTEKSSNNVPAIVRDSQKSDDEIEIDYAKYEKEDYVRRKKEYEDYLENKTVTKLEVGDLVDIRTPEYVWCEGIVRRVVYKPESGIKVAFIHYMGLPNSFDEEICFSSSRLAKHGFLTSRNDIPKLT